MGFHNIQKKESERYPDRTLMKLSTKTKLNICRDPPAFIHGNMWKSTDFPECFP
jgi:hypothetical protein